MVVRTILKYRICRRGDPDGGYGVLMHPNAVVTDFALVDDVFYVYALVDAPPANPSSLAACGGVCGRVDVNPRAFDKPTEAHFFIVIPTGRVLHFAHEPRYVRSVTEPDGHVWHLLELRKPGD